MIYRLKYDRLNYMVFDISFNEIKFKLGNVFALNDTTKQWADIWQPLCGQFFDYSDEQNITSIPDISCWVTDDLILSQKAYAALKEDLSPYGEFLPVTVESLPYWILHVNKFAIANAIDEENSERIINDAGLINMNKLAFHENAVNNLLIFKTEYSGYKNIYCTEKFKALIESLGLKGLRFTRDLACVEEP